MAGERKTFGPMHGESVPRHQDIVGGTKPIGFTRQGEPRATQVIVSTYEVPKDDGRLHVEFYGADLETAVLDREQAAWLRDVLDEYVQAKAGA